jgi:hypothetical protein
MTSKEIRAETQEGIHVADTLKEVLREVGATSEQIKDVSNAFTMAHLSRSGVMRAYE